MSRFTPLLDLSTTTLTSDLSSSSDDYTSSSSSCISCDCCCCTGRCEEFHFLPPMPAPSSYQGISDTTDIHGLPLHSRIRSSDFELTGRSDYRHEFKDFRSPRRARRRGGKEREKYYSHRFVKRGQVGARHLDMRGPEFSLRERLPDEAEVTILDKKLFYGQAQLWPRPLRYTTPRYRRRGVKDFPKWEKRLERRRERESEMPQVVLEAVTQGWMLFVHCIGVEWPGDAELWRWAGIHANEDDWEAREEVVREMLGAEGRVLYGGDGLIDEDYGRDEFRLNFPDGGEEGMFRRIEPIRAVHWDDFWHAEPILVRLDDDGGTYAFEEDWVEFGERDVELDTDGEIAGVTADARHDYDGVMAEEEEEDWEYVDVGPETSTAENVNLEVGVPGSTIAVIATWLGALTRRR